MEFSNETIWIIGAVVIIIIALFVAKKANISFNGKELKLSTDKSKDKKIKVNKLVVKGNQNKTKQDVNNTDYNTFKNNDLEIEGDHNRTKQDVKNADKEKK